MPTYEHEDGIVLRDVEAYACPNCKEFVFTEKQILEVERRTKLVGVHRFAFDRKNTVSGRSLVVNLPEDIVRHFKLAKGQRTRLVPVGDKKIVLEIG